MKIIVLHGSTRKNGNTARLVNEFVKGASKNNDVEIVSVADYKVNPCTSCNACFVKEDHSCCQKDDMNIIYNKLAQADMVVVASPVYCFGVSAQLKAVLDRLHSPIRKTFNVKKLGLLIVAGDTNPEVFKCIELPYTLFCDYFKLEDAGRVLVGGVLDKGDIEGNKGLEEAYNLGLSI
ncbi:flavodoxin family protein [Clostridium saccharoperbutylacetonicum]|uniref:flavodoxin family protein n=1 Tax=Clostridium saccharoperbutylacetonicum TaxID=36745 RepID=UPI0039ECBFE8